MSGARRSGRGGAASELASLAVSAASPLPPSRKSRRGGPVKQEQDEAVVKDEPPPQQDTNGVLDSKDAITRAKRASQRLAAVKEEGASPNNDENAAGNDIPKSDDAVEYEPIKIRIPRPNRRINIRIKKDRIEMEPVKIRISKQLLRDAAAAAESVPAVTPNRTKSGPRGKKKQVAPQQALASVFVKCTAESCGKWRLLSSVNVDPQLWTCSMNPDTQFASCEAPLQEFNGLAPPQDVTAIAAIEVAQPSSAPLTLKDTSEWTEAETEALVEFVAHHGLNAWSRLAQDSILSQNHSNPEFAEERFNMLFGLASGNIKPEPTFNVLRSSGVQHMNNPYVREFLSRYYPHHMSQLRQQYQQYAYHLAQQMVRNPVRAQYVARHSNDGYGGRGGVHFNEDGDSYVTSDSEEEESEESSSGESEELPMDLESDSDDEFGRKKSVAKPKKQRAKKTEEPKFVEYKRPEGARSSGRLSGTVRKSYAFDEFACVDEDESEESGADEEPSERIDKIFATREHLESCAVHKHKSGQSKKVTCECETQYYLKPEGVSYIHCEWLTMSQVEERFRRPGVEKVKRYLKKKDEIDEENMKIWGGEPFNPDFAEVERVIASQMVASGTARGKTVEMFLVKWKELSYGECTWESREDINNESKIEAFIANNTIPDEEEEKAKTVTPTPALIAEWYRESPVFKNGNSLRDYQLQGLNWLVKNHHIGRNTMLADEMGLGKTIQSVALLYHLSHTLRIHGPFMVIVPLSTIGHWQNEIQTWTEMNVVMYHDTVKGKVNRAVIREHEFFYKGTNRVKFHVLLTTYETLLADINDLCNIHWQQLIIDEGHRLKNRNARLLSALMQLQGPPKLGPDGKVQRVPPRRVLLTGTPIQNSTEELWTLLNYIAPFEFYSLDQFMQKFGNLKDSAQVEELQNAIRPYVLRRMKENVEKSIPPKEETIIDIELTTLQKQYYRAIYEKNRAFLSRGLEKSNIPRLINIEMELRKCCNHPWLIKGVEDKEVDPHAPNDVYCSRTIEASGKMVLLDKLLPKLHSEGHRVLIFSQMRQVLDILEFYVEYRGYPYERLDGHTHGNDRQRAIDNFSREGSNRFIFLLSTRAGGVGLNLTAADTVIIFDSDWNPQQDVQAQARVHRIGQQRNVSVYRLITRNTYEAEMFERASKKLGLDQAVLTTMMTDEGGMGEADKQDLERLLRRGAYGVLNDDDTAAKEFCDANIDEILARQSRVVVHKAGTDQSGGSSLGALQYQKMTFTSEGADLDIDINDPHFWEKVLAKEARSGEGTAQDLAKMFHLGLECAEGKPHPLELERQAAEAAAAEADKETTASAPVEGDAGPESAPAEPDSAAVETKPEEPPAQDAAPAAEEPAPAAPEAPPKKKRGRQSAAAKAAAAAAAAAAAPPPKKPEKFVDDRLNFKNVKGRQTFMDALRVKVQRTLSAREAGEHIPDLFELVELLHAVATTELYFSKKQKDQAMQWAKELESRGRRRASRGGFQLDEAYEDAYMSAEDNDPDDMFVDDGIEADGDLPKSGGGRSRGRGATPSRSRTKPALKKGITPAKPKAPPKSPAKSSRKRSRAKFDDDNDDEGEAEKPRRSARPGRYKVKFVMGSDDEVIHSREVDDDDPNRSDANMADDTASAAESTDSDVSNERSGRSNR